MNGMGVSKVYTIELMMDEIKFFMFRIVGVGFLATQDIISLPCNYLADEWVRRV